MCYFVYLSTDDDVDLATVSKDTFLFLENHHFIFCDSREAS